MGCCYCCCCFCCFGCLVLLWVEDQWEGAKVKVEWSAGTLTSVPHSVEWPGNVKLFNALDNYFITCMVELVATVPGSNHLGSSRRHRETTWKTWPCKVTERELLKVLQSRPNIVKMLVYGLIVGSSPTAVTMEVAPCFLACPCVSKHESHSRVQKSTKLYL
jgi:hypothetical protein